MVWRNFPSSDARDAVIDQLLDWAEQASLQGRKSRADELVELAWAAYDQPVARQPVPPRPVPQSILRAFPGLADLHGRQESLSDHAVMGLPRARGKQPDRAAGTSVGASF